MVPTRCNEGGVWRSHGPELFWGATGRDQVIVHNYNLICQHPHITFDAQIALADGGRLLETAPQGLQMLYGNDVTRTSGHQKGLQILYVRTLTRFA